MGALWVVAEPGAGRRPGPDQRRGRDARARAWRAAAGRDVVGIVDRGGSGRRPRRSSPRTCRSSGPSRIRPPPTRLVRRRGRPHRRASPSTATPPTRSSSGPGPDGRDLAGAVSALTGLGVLVNATAVDLDRRRPVGRDERLRRQAASRPRGSPAGRGIITVRPNVDDRGARRDSPAGSRRATSGRRAPALPAVRVVDRVSEAGAAGADRGGADHRRRRSRGRRAGWVRDRRAARRGARRRRRGDARRGRFRLDPVQPADRPDRQDRQARAVPRARDQRRDPAQGRDADVGRDRRGQPRCGRADRRVRRPVRRRRPVRGRRRRSSSGFAPGRAERGAGDTDAMELAVLLPIAAFIALAAGLAVVLPRHRPDRRADARAGAVPGAVKDLAARVDASLGGAAGQIDAVRRRQVGPDDDRRHDRGRDRRGRALRRRGTGAARPAHGAARSATDLVAELERARAGRSGWSSTGPRSCSLRGAARASSRRRPSIKRGYLNLIHAREAIARHALEAAAKLEADDGRRAPVGGAPDLGGQDHTI